MIEVLSFRPGTQGAGTYAVGSATLKRTSDSLSTALVSARVKQIHFPLVEIGIGSKTFCLVDASVSSISDTGGGQPSESVSFNFQAVYMTYGGGWTPRQDSVIFALTSDSGGVHARVDCLTRSCAGKLSVAGVGKVWFTVPGGRSRTRDLHTAPRAIPTGARSPEASF
jgi:hypothetical protein